MRTHCPSRSLQQSKCSGHDSCPINKYGVHRTVDKSDDPKFNTAWVLLLEGNAIKTVVRTARETL